MTTELDIRQQIFAEFIKLNEIEKAIQYAKDSELTEEEQVQALENGEKGK